MSSARAAAAAALAVLVLVAALPRSHADEPAAASLEARIDDVDALFAALARVGALQASYREEKTLALMTRPLVSHGTLYYVAPDTLALHTHEPTRGIVRVDAHRLRFSDETGQAHELDLDGNDVVRQIVDGFRKVLAGDGSALRALYTLDFTPGETWRLVLTPRSEPLSGLVSRIELEGRGARLDTLRVEEANGDRTVTTFDAIVVDPSQLDRARLDQLLATP